MAVKANDQITVMDMTDVSAVKHYYLKQSSTSAAPSKPTAYPPGGSWTETEPGYSAGETMTLYTVTCTVFSNGTFDYSAVSTSSAYEAAKQAYNTAVAAANAASEATPELIVGTHGTTATATWKGKSTRLSAITSGTVIRYKLSSAGAANVTLNLTLKGGGTTGAKAVYYSNTTRLSTQYGINATIELIYDGTYWRVLNPYTNSNTIGTYAATALVADTTGIGAYSLIMERPNGKWASFTTTWGYDSTTKTRNTNGFVVGSKVYYHAGSSAYSSGNKCTTCYGELSIDLRYSTNCGSTLTAGKRVYIVGTISANDGLFYLDATWWTQTEPSSADGKTYIYVGIAASTTSVYKSAENQWMQFYSDGLHTLEEVARMKLDDALNAEGVFNRLTNNGTMQGIYMEDGNLYINMTYLKTGALVVKDASGNEIARFDATNKSARIGGWDVVNGTLQKIGSNTEIKLSSSDSEISLKSTQSVGSGSVRNTSARVKKDGNFASLEVENKLIAGGSSETSGARRNIQGFTDKRYIVSGGVEVEKVTETLATDGKLSRTYAEKVTDTYSNGADVSISAGKNIDFTAGAGNVKVKTQDQGDNSTNAASTAYVDNLLTGLEIGGRNLVPNSSLATAASLSVWYPNNFEITTMDGRKCAHATGGTSKDCNLYASVNDPVCGDLANQPYVFTADVMLVGFAAASGCYDALQVRGTNLSNNGSATPIVDDGYDVSRTSGTLRSLNGKGWVRVKSRFHFASSQKKLEIFVRFKNLTGDLYIRNVQIERGKVATDWRPAPED